MKLPRLPHSWSLTPRQAIALQQQMAGLVSPNLTRHRIQFIAGLDAAFSKDDQLCFATAVLWDMRGQRVIEQHTTTRRLAFPYVPGLLSFREVPSLLAALRKLKCRPDLLMCDGQGLAHPRRFGLACHLGVICGLPSLGCAKSRLIGTHTGLPRPRGSRAALLDKGEVIGTVLRTQTGIKPVYVSIGHKIDLRTAEEIVLACAVRHRLPEPTRLADRLVTAFKRDRVGREKRPAGTPSLPRIGRSNRRGALNQDADFGSRTGSAETSFAGCSASADPVSVASSPRRRGQM